MDDAQKERLAELCRGLPRERMAQAGREFLEGNLHHRVRKQRRWFWAAFAVIVAATVFAAILLVVYLLEKTEESADGFQHRREEQLQRSVGGD